ncbi:MAG TPA: hypothetical protein ENK52_03410 [Saprospiraceae bacterium]|nr:hypothetical protein [Saprospiraceae bacterium]
MSTEPAWRAIGQGRRYKLKLFKVLIQLFPYTINRVAALPFELIQNLSLPDDLQIENSEDAFNSFFLATRKLLQSYFEETDLKNSLALSSHSFVERLLSYHQKPINTFRKKERQTEIKFLQYLARSCAKTSPFSSLTKLAAWNIEKSESPFPIYNNRITINRQIFFLLKSYLKNDSDYYANLNIRLNTTIWKKENQYLFLLNINNLESIIELERADILDFIIARLPSSKNYALLIEELKSELDFDESSLDHYLQSLIAQGFLEWEWPVNPDARDWVNVMLLHFQNCSDFYVKEQFIDFCKRLQTTTNDFANSDLLKRIALQKQSLADWNLLKEYLDNKQLKDQFDFSNQIKLSPEKIFYEDCTATLEKHPSKAFLSERLSLLKKCLRISASFIEKQKQKELLNCFLNKNENKEPIPFLQFYQHYYQSKKQAKSVNQKTSIGNSKQEVAVLQAFSFQNGILSITKEQLLNLSKAISTRKEPIPFSSLIQIAGNQLVVNAVAPGYGKLYTRFLPLFPKEMENELKNYNKLLTQKEIFVENKDASHFNTNIESDILDVEIAHTQSADIQQQKHVGLKDIVVARSSTKDKLKLFHRLSQKEIKIIDLSIESLETRSPSFQLLQKFSNESPSIKTLLILLNQEYKIQYGNILFYPRIEIAKKLILQRKKWIIPKDEIPNRKKYNSFYDYFKAINNWRKSIDLPQYVFVKLSLKQNLNSRTQHKPQLIDFQSPLFMQLFQKISNKEITNLQIEEMLPKPDQLMPEKGRSFVTEILIQGR